jgi:transcriptional regulator with XRE-family HTH domain
MDCKKVGELLLFLRKESGMTQKQVADRMNISDKTISKWERGLGCPDITLLEDLSNLFKVNIEKILSGDLEPSNLQAGNLKRTKFYICPNCANISYSTGNADISCCGRKLSPLRAAMAEEKHSALIEEIEGEYYIRFNHEMSKTHFIHFVAYVLSDRVLLVKLYPEQEAAVRLPIMSGGALQQRFGGTLYYYCSQHGLWVI